MWIIVASQVVVVSSVVSCSELCIVCVGEVKTLESNVRDSQSGQPTYGL
jgi:hypothetical protein